MKDIALKLTLVLAPGVVGIPIVAWGLRILRRERATRRWPTTTATVASSAVQTYDRTVRDAEGSAITTTYWQQVVAYEYVAHGNTLTGTKIKLSGVTDSWNVPRANAYPVGTKIEIHYDPADPTNAFIRTGTPGGAIFLLIFGGVFVSLFLLGILLVVLSG